MKSYPSIPGSTGQSFRAFEAHVFDKIDGSCLRFEWSAKRGFYKFGTRTRLFDGTDPDFGSAVDIFIDQFADPLSVFAKKARWKGCTAYAEFHGPNSFAGLHDPEDVKQLTLIDMDIYKQGLMDPRDFVELGLIVPIARYFGCIKWTRGFVAEIREGGGDIVPTFEGVVGKAKTGRKRIMAKAKTQAWVDKVHALYAPTVAERIVNS
jgi:hypothetical protein